MKAALTVAASLILTQVSGCVHGAQNGAPLGVVIQPSVAQEAAGIVAVTVTNATGEARCVHADILENPGTNYVSVRLRRNGRTIKPPEGGLPMPPKRAGLVRLSPTDQMRFDLDVFGHFSPSQIGRREGLEARVGIGSSPCSNPTIGQVQVSWSGWTEVR